VLKYTHVHFELLFLADAQRRTSSVRFLHKWENSDLLLLLFLVGRETETGEQCAFPFKFCTGGCSDSNDPGVCVSVVVYWCVCICG